LEDPVRTSRLFVPLAGLAASTLVLTACGSSGGGGGGSASATGSSTSATSAAASSTAASSAAASSGAAAGPATTAQLQKIVIQVADLPSTYKATAADPDDTSDKTDVQLQQCTGVTGAPDSHKVHTVQSSDFTKGDTTLSSEFSSYQSEADVTADVALLKSPKINQCLNSVFKASLAKSLGSKTTVTASNFTLTPGSNGGPSNLAGTASGVVKFTAGGQAAAVYVGVAFVTGPQIDGTLSFVSLNTPLDNATSTGVLTAVAQRAANP
jgi:hypothetical protein